MRPIRTTAAIFSTLLAVVPFCSAQPAPSTGSAPFVFDGNRIYAELQFIRPDGTTHRALAFVDMGSPSMVVTSGLFKELGGDKGIALSFRVGALPVTLPAKEVTSDPSEPYSVGTELKVEAVLPAGVMQKYVVVLDYAHRTLILARPGTVKPEGIAVPFRVNPQTGLIAVDVSIDGRSYPVTIDNGSAYTWFRQDTAKLWLKTHPDWERGIGAVGPANMMMSGESTEAAGVLLRIPQIAIGQLLLNEVASLAAGKGRGPGPNQDLFDWYSTKNAVPVIGWIGGNVLKSFRISIDYANKKMYWQRSAPDSYQLNQVGLVLKFEAGKYTVAAIATKNGKPTLEAVQIDDKLIGVDNLELKNATWGQIYDAMHGNPGEIKMLEIERAGNLITVRAPVTAF
ncbi:MAG TPA: hypothetical protein VFW25_06625 [Silvibacterium sp.]|nr:hypothetical protein [Silvibacterium sp.]